VSVAAGVVRDAPVVAVIARFDMPAQGGGAAGRNRPEDALLFSSQTVDPMSMLSNDLGQFQRRALDGRVHGIGGLGV
jgi:hypothetical protein